VSDLFTVRHEKPNTAGRDVRRLAEADAQDRHHVMDQAGLPRTAVRYFDERKSLSECMFGLELAKPSRRDIGAGGEKASLEHKCLARAFHCSLSHGHPALNIFARIRLSNVITQDTRGSIPRPLRAREKTD
jgi:hypothetical protein